MSQSVPAVVLEGISSATGIDRSRILKTIDELRESLRDYTGEIKQRVGAIMTNSRSASTQFDDVVDYAETSPFSDAVKAKVFAALGLAFIGGILLTFKVVIATVLGIILLLLAGYLAMAPLRAALAALEQGFKKATTW